MIAQYCIDSYLLSARTFLAVTEICIVLLLKFLLIIIVISTLWLGLTDAVLQVS